MGIMADIEEMDIEEMGIMADIEEAYGVQSIMGFR